MAKDPEGHKAAESSGVRTAGIPLPCGAASRVHHGTGAEVELARKAVAREEEAKRFAEEEVRRFDVEEAKRLAAEEARRFAAAEEAEHLAEVEAGRIAEVWLPKKSFDGQLRNRNVKTRS